MAYWSFPTSRPVAPHERAWVETLQPDPQTTLLWKFNTDADEAEALDALLESDDIFILPETTPGLQTAADDIRDTPELEGDARLAEGAGRFGSGLALGGRGYAKGTAPLQSMLRSDSAFTLDFWFRAATLPETEAPSLLAALLCRRQTSLVRLWLTSDGQVELEADGQIRLTGPAPCLPETWHHLALVWSSGRATLLVDDGIARTAEDAARNWLSQTTASLGTSFTVGGGPAQAGLSGAIDEVRFSRGIRYFYRHHLGRQESDRTPEPVQPPFFRDTQILTRLDFDGTLAPALPDGSDWSGIADDSHFRQGFRGQAIDLSRINATGFALRDITLPPNRQATLEFWFRPLNWNNFFRGNYHGTDLPSGQSLLRLAGTDSARTLTVHRGTAGSNGRLPWARIHPGQWTHVLISLSGGRQTQYLNGERTRFGQVWLAGGAAPPWTLEFIQSPTLIDQFALYGWAMNDDEAHNAYVRWLPDAREQLRELPLFEFAFSYVAHCWNMRERLDTTLTCMPVDTVRPATADIEIRNEAGEILLDVTARELDNTGSVRVTLEQALPFGRYPVRVRSRDNQGAVLAEESHAYIRERPAWYENTLGRERTVPSPWIPLTVADRTLSLVDRLLTLGADGLPARIETRGRDILAGPVTITATPAGGTPAPLTGQGATFQTADPDRVSWRADAESALVTAAIEAWIEFDGLLYCTVTLRPRRTDEETRIAALAIDFPMHSDAATQLIANGGGNNFRISWLARYVPQGEGSVWNSGDKPYPAFTRAIGLSNYMPHIWLGNDEVGLYFGGDNDRGWTVGGKQAAQEIIRRPDTVVFRMNVIRETTVIGSDGHTFHFVLLPTPAKPAPDDWRYMVTEGHYSFGSMDSFGGNCMKTCDVDPEAGDSFRLKPKSWEYAAAASATQREKWGLCILYADASWPRPGPSFADWNHDLWAGTGRIAWTPEFEDYVVWVVNEYLDRGLIDGIYFDDVSVGHTFSPAATAYPFEAAEQKRRIGFTALAQRRVLQRLWRVFLAHGKDPGISLHMTYAYEVPVFSFAKYLYNAEIFSGVSYPRERDAMDEWPADRMRILAGAVKWGAGHPFISTLPRGFDGMDANWVYRQKRTEDAAFLTADVIGAAAPWFGANLRREGVFARGVRGYPFWASAPLIAVGKPDDAHLQTAVYAHDDRAYVVVANRNREEHEVTLQVHADTLFPGASRMVWTDIDPGLKPPTPTVAGARELAQLKPGADIGIFDDPVVELDEDGLLDLLEGSTPAERALQRLELRIEEDTARLIVRPRDFRILKVQPAR